MKKTPSRFSSQNLISWALPVFVLAALAVPGSVRGILSVSRGRTPTLEARENAMPLAGATVPEEHPHFHRHDWLSGDFQAKYARWFGQNFGLRSRMVRLDNQVGYTIFHKSNNVGASIIVGRNKMLYESLYIQEYCDLQPRMTDTQMETVARDMADVGTRLRARGVGFVVYITPSKAALYPENIPPAFLARKTGQARGYDRLIASMRQHHVLFVDGHKALMDAKNTGATLPLYCRGGIHHNELGMFYAARPLMQALEKEGGKPIPPLVCPTPIPTDYSPTGQDTDMAQLLNVWFPPTYYLTPHPQLTFDGKIIKGAAGRLSVVGGSFCWQPIWLLDKNHVYEQIDYYYYYRTELHRFPGEKTLPLDVATLDWNSTFLRSNVIVLEINEQCLYDNGNNHFLAFLQDAKRKLPPVEKSVAQN